MPAFNVSYRWIVREGQEEEFIFTWKKMQREIRKKYPTIISAELSRGTNLEFTSKSKWESRDAWEKFWVTKEIVIREIAMLRFLIKKSSEPEFTLSITVDEDDDNTKVSFERSFN